MSAIRCSVRPLSHYAGKLAYRHPHLPPVWVVIPQPHFVPPLGDTTANHTDTRPVWGLGRRVLYLPPNSAICATWSEAMDYATTGRQQRPIAELYPSWCGI